ncbi:hypothetical protein JXA40_03830 [bacterium]|nr:hypothetical protein [candidate division CSSED10-310 bacterium]
MTKFCIATVTLIMMIGSCTALSDERMDRSFSVFEKSLDDLLLETAHVYVRIDDKVKSFFLKDVGAFFLGDISMTSLANASIMIQEWSEWFGGSRSGEDEARDQEAAIKKEEYLKKKSHYEQLLEKDKERLEKMDEHLVAFKKELATTVLDFGSILKGLSARDEIVVVFFVKDSEFKDKYGSTELIMRISFGQLSKLNQDKVDVETAMRAFHFNL